MELVRLHYADNYFACQRQSPPSTRKIAAGAPYPYHCTDRDSTQLDELAMQREGAPTKALAGVRTWVIQTTERTVISATDRQSWMTSAVDARNGSARNVTRYDRPNATTLTLISIMRATRRSAIGEVSAGARLPRLPVLFRVDLLVALGAQHAARVADHVGVAAKVDGRAARRKARLHLLSVEALR
jgi:hypothetical protein